MRIIQSHRQRATATGIVCLFITLLLFFPGCEKEISDAPVAVEKVRFSVVLPATVETRALESVHEATIKYIDILIFDQATQQFIETVEVEEADITDDPSDPSFKTVEVEIRKGTFDLIFLANSRVEVYQAGLTAGMSKPQAIQKLTFDQTGKWNATPAAFKPFPMWGELPGIEIQTGVTDLTGSVVPMLRSVVRIDVNLAESVHKPNTYTTLYISSVRLYKANNRGQIIPDYGNLFTNTDGFPQVSAPSIPVTASAIPQPILYIPETKLYQYQAEIYTLEATRGSLHTWDKHTCLVVGIGGELEEGGGVTRTISEKDSIHYYRIDFITENPPGQQQYMPLLRNQNYSITVNRVVNNGFYHWDDAYRSEAYSIEYEIIEFKQGEGNGDRDRPSYYVMEIEPASISIPRGGDGFTVRIYCDHPTPWSYSIGADTNPSMFMSLSATPVSGVASDLTVLCASNPFQTERTGTINITAGNMTSRIRVTQAPGFAEAR